MRTFLLASIGFVIAAASTGCEKSGDSEPPPTGSAPATATISTWPATQRADGDSFTVTLRPIGDAIERGQHFSLEVTVDPEKTADTGAAELEVVVDADMPAHRHGMNTKPEIVAEGDRRYRVDGMLFHMAGDWVITVDVNRGTESERATFPVHVE